MAMIKVVRVKLNKSSVEQSYLDKDEAIDFLVKLEEDGYKFTDEDVEYISREV